MVKVFSFFQLLMTLMKLVWTKVKIIGKICLFIRKRYYIVPLTDERNLCLYKLLSVKTVSTWHAWLVLLTVKTFDQSHLWLPNWSAIAISIVLLKSATSLCISSLIITMSLTSSPLSIIKEAEFTLKFKIQIMDNPLRFPTK